MKRSDLNNEATVERIDEYLRKIANNKIKTDQIHIDFNDLVQEYWLMVMGILDKKEFENFGSFLSYVSKSCNYKTVDLVRKNIKNEYMTVDLANFDKHYLPKNEANYVDFSSKDEGTSIYNFCSASKFTDPDTEFLRKSIIDIFSENEEKERKLLVAWMEIEGLVEVDNPEKLPTSAYDRYIAVEVLGYASSSSSGYKTLRNKVRNRIIETGYYNAFKNM